MKGIYVFLGPTLARDIASEILNVTYLPPAMCGDVQRLVYRPHTRAMGIGGAFFESVPMVFHKEILHAIHCGIAVYGAASTGALRAAELCDYGMVGIGRVFNQYYSGELEDDDEVAVIHAPAELHYHPLSEALVDIRDKLSTARDEGVINCGQFNHLCEYAKSLFFADRCWDKLYNEATALEVNVPQLRCCIERGRKGVKHRDAVALLRRMRADIGTRRTISWRAKESFQRTSYWRRLSARIRTEAYHNPEN